MRSLGPVALRPMVFRSWTFVTESRLREDEPFRYDSVLVALLEDRIVPRILILILGLPFLVGACAKLTPYRMEIQQGNFVTPEMVAQLNPGLTRDQVRFVLGTPLVSDIFHEDRWDYVFVRRRASKQEVEYHRIAVFFQEGRLKRVEGDVAAAPGKDRP